MEFVKATRDGQRHNEGDVGIFIREECIDSDNYFFVKLLDGTLIGPTADSYWKKHQGVILENLSIVDAVQFLVDNLPDESCAIFSASNRNSYVAFAHWNGNNLIDTHTKRAFEFDSNDITKKDWSVTTFRTYEQYFESI